MKRWKVVGEHDRASLFVYDEYRITYTKGVRVETRPGTCGIFVFDTKTNAEKYVRLINLEHGWRPLIIKVEAHGRGTRLRTRPTFYDPVYIPSMSSFIKTHINKLRLPHQVNIPFNIGNFVYKDDGTMLYQAVTPLE